VSHWGFDTFDSVNRDVNGEGLTVYDVLNRHFQNINLGQSPEFIGRYLRGKNQLTQAEADYIHSKGCRIVPIWNLIAHGQTNEQQAGMNQKGDAGRQFGASEAILAVTAAQWGLSTLGGGICIYADVEPKLGWCPSVDFFVGWWETLSFHGYRAGLYMRVGPQNTGTTAKLEEASQRMLPLQPKDLYLWSLNPWRGHPPIPSFSEAERPNSTVLHNSVVMWQYGEKLADSHNRYDSDIADDRAYDAMW
jgi:hypothetical protein